MDGIEGIDMRKLMLAVAVGVMAWAAPAAQAQDTPPRLVTVVTSAEPQTQLMAMVLSFQAQSQGADVHMLLCGPGGDIALAEPPAAVTAPQGPQGMNPQKLMGRIMQNGATVEVCALYLPNKGVGEDALIDGVSAAEPGPMAAALLAPDTRLLTF
jgi:predicted peroxiredoxin